MIINLSEIMSVKGQVKNIQAPFELKSITYSGMECLVERSSQVDLTVSHTGERKVEIEGETEVDLLISCNSHWAFWFQTHIGFSQKEVQDFHILSSYYYFLSSPYILFFVLVQIALLLVEE